MLLPLYGMWGYGWLHTTRTTVLSMILGWPGARNSVMVPDGEIKAGSNAFPSTQLTRLSRPRLFQRFAARVARGGFGLREHRSIYRNERDGFQSEKDVGKKEGRATVLFSWMAPPFCSRAGSHQVWREGRTLFYAIFVRMSKFFWLWWK